MARYQPTKEELDQAYADVEPHWPEIIKTNQRLTRILLKMPPVAQKQTLCMLAATWVVGHRTAEDEKGFDLVDALREQIKLYLIAEDGGMN